MMKLHAEAADQRYKEGGEALFFFLIFFFLAASYLVKALALLRVFNAPIMLVDLAENYAFLPVTMFSVNNEINMVHKKV